MMAAEAAPLPELDPPWLVEDAPLVSATGVTKRYGGVVALEAVSLSALPGEVLGIVGESGSGKSTLLRLLNLEEAPDEGSYGLDIEGYAGQDLFGLDRFERRALRVRHLGIVYQNPHQGLRMRHTSGGNVAERLLVAGERSFGALRSRARAALDISEFPLDRVDDLPLHLSGGMQQRVQLAKAVALGPELLLLDEPTTGLDVSVQALVLDTLKRLGRARRMTMLVVSHDLGVIRVLADRVLVMRNGRVVEEGLTDQVLGDPQHPYTQALVQAEL